MIAIISTIVYVKLLIYFFLIQIYASYKLRTYLMGYPYDSEEDAYEDTAFQKKMMKLSL